MKLYISPSMYVIVIIRNRKNDNYSYVQGPRRLSFLRSGTILYFGVVVSSQSWFVSWAFQRYPIWLRQRERRFPRGTRRKRVIISAMKDARFVMTSEAKKEHFEIHVRLRFHPRWGAFCCAFTCRKPRGGGMVVAHNLLSRCCHQSIPSKCVCDDIQIQRRDGDALRTHEHNTILLESLYECP